MPAASGLRVVGLASIRSGATSRCCRRERRERKNGTGRSRCVVRGAVWMFWFALLLVGMPASAQTQAPSEKLLINSQSAFIWSRGGTQVIQMEGPLTVTLDNA